MEGGDEEHREEVENLQYFIELKYQTNGITRARKAGLPIKDSSCEGIGFETMSHNKQDPLKPATIHFFVGKSTYDSFGEATNETPWDLATLRQRAKEDPIIANQARKIEHYLEGVEERGGTCTDAKIKGLPITIYRSSELVKLHDRRIVVLVGDAAAGAVFARGVNKAFKEAAALAQAMYTFFQRGDRVEDAVPPEFTQYTQEASAIFKNEKWWAKAKAFCLNIARVTWRYALKPFKLLYSIVATIFSFLPSLQKSRRSS